MSKPTSYKYNPESVVKCLNCNSEFIFGSTIDSLTIEVCGNCHPFYTGKDTVVDTAGRIEKFNARLAKVTKDSTKTKKQKQRKIRQNLSEMN